MSTLPTGWTVDTTGSRVYLESVDGDDPPLEFELFDVDALAIGVALIRSSERARAVRAVSDLAEERVESEALLGGGTGQQGECASAEGGDREDLTVEIREPTDDQSVSAVEAWLPGWHWPAVRAVRRGAGWLVLVDPVVSATAGVEEAARSALDAIDAGEARIWVKMLAALYVKAAGK
ncbi:hypothetical protein [Mycobacterium sp. 1245852.3]|uniref:hypothetical protein n=1 Tax=Mycobacterium sp. 1245852.3 TaxID=1856860 RepID=UPI0007FBC244|nr:hypothetical protein [Mycobacterium sp. 1245852.3]OBJ93992.1 hypothetical protein A9W96_20805 [Mycobacterium sp. 1245852.3]